MFRNNVSFGVLFFCINWCVKTWPATSTFKFLTGAKQGFATANTAIRAWRFCVPVCASKPINKGLDSGTRRLPFNKWKDGDTLLRSCWCKLGHIRIPQSAGCYDPVRSIGKNYFKRKDIYLSYLVAMLCQD